jgi:photosystem II stability/assembly factor-like uncharacterized protein
VIEKLVTRRRVTIAAIVAAVLGVIAALGAFSGNTAAVTVTAGTGGVPYATWYWTMAVAPKDENTLVLGTNTGLYRSADAGKTWSPVGPKGVQATSLVQAGDDLIMGGVVSKNPGGIVRKGAGRVAPDGPAAVAKSTDGGKTWQTLHPSGLPNVTIQAMAVAPQSTTAIYALLNTGALYRSADEAQSFQLVSKKLGIAPWALANTQGSEFVSGDMDSGPHVSANGKTWQPTSFKDSRGGKMVMEYATQPNAPTHILMSSIGVVLSTDGGKSWHTSLKSTVMFGPVTWVPEKPTVAYAVGFDQSLWRTDNAGKTWKKVV